MSQRKGGGLCPIPWGRRAGCDDPVRPSNARVVPHTLPRRGRRVPLGPRAAGHEGRVYRKHSAVYSLGCPEALTQLLHQRFGLPFFSDVREELPGDKSAATRHMNKTPQSTNTRDCEVKLNG